MRLPSRRLPEPWIVLGPLLAVQWIALVAFALTVRHNGWLYYQGGDETYYYSTSWLMSHWWLPTTPVGYAWSYLTTPIALFAGPNVLNALPAVIVLNTVVLAPIALCCVYGIAARIGGRLLGYWAGLLWVAIPFLAIPLWVERYHQKYVELFLPQALGFTNLADYPSTVCLLVAAYFAVRALDGTDWRDAVYGGVAAGFALGLKPANGLFLVGAALAFLASRKWRQALPYAAAIVPAVITLTLWKDRGLGRNPAIAAPDWHYGFLPVLAFLHPVTKYVHVDWHHLGQNMDQLREFFWSVRPLEFVPIAGTIAVARRSVPKALLLAGWFFAYFFIKGSTTQASVEDASFFRLLMPAFPAYLLLGASLPLLVPTYGARLAERFPAAARLRPPGWRRVAVAGAVFAAIPLVMVGALRTLRSPLAVKYYAEGVFVPVDTGFHVDARVHGRQVTLRWRNPGGSADVFYRIFRLHTYQPDFETAANPPILEGLRCLAPQRSGGAKDCEVLMEQRGVGPKTTFSDPIPPGRWTYRVAMSANWLDDPTLGDVLLLSRPADIVVK